MREYLLPLGTETANKALFVGLVFRCAPNQPQSAALGRTGRNSEANICTNKDGH